MNHFDLGFFVRSTSFKYMKVAGLILLILPLSYKKKTVFDLKPQIKFGLHYCCSFLLSIKSHMCLHTKAILAKVNHETLRKEIQNERVRERLIRTQSSNHCTGSA